MNFFARHIALRRTLAGFLAAVLASGCMTWKPEMKRSDALLAQHPTQTRLVLEHGTQVDVQTPTVLGDYVFGYKRLGDQSSRVAVPVNSVRTVERKAFDPIKTTLLAGAATVAGIVLVGTVQAMHAQGLKIRF